MDRDPTGEIEPGAHHIDDLDGWGAPELPDSAREDWREGDEDAGGGDEVGDEEGE